MRFNSTCLCEPDTYREKAPLCIDCLYRNNVETDVGDTLMKGMRGCIDGLGYFPCPVACKNLNSVLDYCTKKDAARLAAEAASRAAETASIAATGSISATVGTGGPSTTGTGLNSGHVFHSPRVGESC